MSLIMSAWHCYLSCQNFCGHRFTHVFDDFFVTNVWHDLGVTHDVTCLDFCMTQIARCVTWFLCDTSCVCMISCRDFCAVHVVTGLVRHKLICVLSDFCVTQGLTCLRSFLCDWLFTLVWCTFCVPQVEVHSDKGVAVLHMAGTKEAESILQVCNTRISEFCSSLYCRCGVHM